MSETAPGGGFSILDTFISRSREKALAQKEQPLVPKNMSKLAELIDKEMKGGEAFDDAFDHIFPTDWWRKVDISPENLPRYAEFARDYFAEKYPKAQKDLFDD